MTTRYCPRCWSEVAGSRGRCPSCGTSLAAEAAPAKAALWSDSLVYDLFVDDLNAVTDRKALVAYLISSGRFPDREQLAAKLGELPCRLLDGLTLEQSTEIKSNLLRLGARVRAIRSDANGTTVSPAHALARRFRRPRRRANVRAVRGWFWLAAITMLVAMVLGTAQLFRHFDRSSVSLEQTKERVDAESGPLVRVTRRERAMQTGNPNEQKAHDEIELGHVAVNATHFSEAIGHYRSALALDPSNGEAREALADAWVALGQSALAERGLDRAIEDFENALEVEADERPALRGLGHAALLAGDLPRATHAWDRLELLGEVDAEAHGWAAETFHASGELERAAREYRLQLAASPDPRVSERLALAERERGALHEATAHYDMAWLGAIDPATRRSLRDALERAHAEAAKELGLEAPSQIRITFDGKPAFTLRAGIRCGWQWTKLPGPRVAVGGLGPNLDPRLPLVLRHEIAHAILRAALAGKLPAWLEEGIARRVEVEATAAGDSTSASPAPAGSAPPASLVSLEELRWPFSTLAPERWDFAFATADASTTTLLGHGDWPALRRVLTQVAHGSALNDALQRELHGDLESLNGEIAAHPAPRTGGG